MQAVDTNVLVRILIDDPKEMNQVHIARRYAKRAGQLFVTQIVQVELVWVMDAAYDLNKSEVISVLKHMQDNEAFFLQNESQYAMALHHYQTKNVDFSDCLILAECHQEKCEVVTFDNKFSRLPEVHLLQ